MTTNSDDQMFDSLMSNAIDFMQTSIAELEDNPKYSVINFYASIELILKARLMLEHWSLVFAEPQHANKNRFREGDFNSVGMDEAVKRIGEVIGTNISTEQKKIFTQIRHHRNKLVHFFHPSYVNPNREILGDIAAEQCRGWHEIHKLVTRKWRNEFKNYLSSIERLQSLMLCNRQFLEVRYENVAQDIAKGKERGKAFLICDSCKYESVNKKNIMGPVVQLDCLVCERQEIRLIVQCNNCGEDMLLQSELEEANQCKSCGNLIDIDYLLYYFQKPTRPKEQLEIERYRAYCHSCGYHEYDSATPTVIPFDDSWLCLYCFTIHEQRDIHECDYCGSLYTGPLRDSYLRGCLVCDGKFSEFDF